jgi:predicted metal-dependent phosphoesterase TrpH
LEKGYVPSVDYAFKTVLNEKNGLYVPPARMNIIDAIRFLVGIDALPVLAHPLVDLSEEELRMLLPEAIKAGLVGIETMHSKYSESDLYKAEQIAKEFNLLQSGGSDFHGEPKPDVFLGVGKGNLNIPFEFYSELLTAKVKKKLNKLLTK